LVCSAQADEARDDAEESFGALFTRLVVFFYVGELDCEFGGEGGGEVVGGVGFCWVGAFFDFCYALCEVARAVPLLPAFVA
jgi:hypothetical protein